MLAADGVLSIKFIIFSSTLQARFHRFQPYKHHCAAVASAVDNAFWCD